MQTGRIPAAARLTLTVMALLSSGPVSAASNVTGTVAGVGVSHYMFRGLRLSDGGLQPAVEVAADMWAVGVWTNFPVNGDKVPGSSDPEVDLYGSYNIALSADTTLTPGFTWYHYPNAPERNGFYRSTFEPSLALSRAFKGVRFTPKIYYDVVRKGPTYELTALYALPLQNIGSELDFTATFGGYRWKESAPRSSPEVKAWGDYWLLGLAMPFQFSATSRITAGFAYAKGQNAYIKAGANARTANPLAGGRGVVTVAYVRTF